MEDLSNRERELVAVGAAIASNCVPCIQYHIPEARKAGLDDHLIGEAVRLADQVRQVPSKKVLQSALSLLGDGAAPEARSAAGACEEEGTGQGCCT